MQMHTLLLAASLLAFTAGCKDKQALPDTSAKPAATEPAQVNATATPPTTEGVQEPASTAKAGDDSIFFSIERTPCFGSCPTYKLTILQDGSATYVGRRFAAREGSYRGHVDAGTMGKLKAAAETNGFYGMQDKYDEPVTDLPSVIIRVHADSRDKQVIGRVGAPQSFKLLTKEVEALLGGVEWTKVEEAR